MLAGEVLFYEINEDILWANGCLLKCIPIGLTKKCGVDKNVVF